MQKRKINSGTQKDKVRRIVRDRVEVPVIDGDLPNMFREKVLPKLDLVMAWVRDGATEKQIADRLEISSKSIQRYKSQVPAFGRMLEENKQWLDEVHMINAYQMRAEGYTTIEIEREYKVNEDGSSKLVKVRERERHVPADTRALENWIQLRMKNHELWGQLQDVLHNNEVGFGGEGGLVFIPSKKALEIAEKNGNNMDTPTETT